MRKRAVTLAVGLVVALIIVGVVVYAGFYNVAASSPHAGVVRWLLDFGMQRSVAAHAPETPSPPLDDPALIEAGLRHYQQGCESCHGGPGVAAAAFTQAMLPSPPDLAGRVERFSDNELFWIIKHGLKYTGMPGWPTQERDDEVWAVVAFVRLLPTLSPSAYLAMAEATPGGMTPGAGDVGTALNGLSECAACHGIDGAGSASGAFPRLSGLGADYILAQLLAFRSGERPSGFMMTATATSTTAELTALAAFYGAVEAPAVVAPSSAAGAAVVAGIPDRAIPPCLSCHDRADTIAPPIAGQYAGYVAEQLRLFAEGVRFHSVMSPIAARLTSDEIEAVARYLGP